MKKFILTAAVLSLSATAAYCAIAPAKVADVLNHKKDFDGKEICLTGPVEELDARVSRKGNHYFTFKMSEAGQTIKIFSQGDPSFKDGQQVTACGKYEIARTVGAQTFHDEVAASTGTITVLGADAKEAPKTDAKAAPAAKEDKKAQPAAKTDKTSKPAAKTAPASGK